MERPIHITSEEIATVQTEWNDFQLNDKLVVTPEKLYTLMDFVEVLI